MADADLLILSADVVPDQLGPVEIGSMIIVCHVAAIHAIKDIKEQLRNVLGGQMTHYELLLNGSAEAAMQKLRERLLEGGWNGAYAVRFSHPSLVEGGCEILVCATPFRFAPAN